MPKQVIEISDVKSCNSQNRKRKHYLTTQGNKSDVKYLVVTSDGTKWRYDLEMTKAISVTGTFIRAYCLFKRELLSADTKLTLHKAHGLSVMAYICPAWEFALTETASVKQKVLCIGVKFARHTQTPDFHVDFKVLKFDA